MSLYRRVIISIDNKYVDGWDDPRMPTISGFKRRGYSPESIKMFCNKIGVAKRVTFVSYISFSPSILTKYFP